MTIVGTILNTNLALIGLRVKSKGNFYNYRLSDFISRGFKNNQIDCSGGRVVEIGNFKLRDLDCFASTNKGIVPINNSIEIQNTIVDDFESSNIVGYTVNFRGLKKTVNLKAEQLLNISYLFKPVGFSVYRKGTKVVIKGTGGNKIGDLPSLVASGDESRASSNEHKSENIEYDEITNLFVPRGLMKDIASEIDLSDMVPIASKLDVFDNIVKFKGVIVGRYKNKKKSSNDADYSESNIRYLDGASNSNAKIILSSNNTNVNVRYNYGIMANIDGKEYPAKVMTFDSVSKDKQDIYTTLLVMINKGVINEFMHVFGEIAQIIEMDDCEARAGYREGCVKVKIDIEKLPLVDNRLADKYKFVSTESLEKIVIRLKQLKACQTILNAYAKEKGIEDKSFVDYKIMRYYSSHYDERELDKLTENGLDVTTGSLRLNSGKSGSYMDNSALYSEFNVDGAVNLVSKNLVAGKIPEVIDCDDIRNTLKLFDENDVAVERYNNFKEAVSNEIASLTETLWFYRYFNSTDKGFNDGKNWSRVESKRISGDKVKLQLVGTSVILTVKKPV